MEASWQPGDRLEIIEVGRSTDLRFRLAGVEYNCRTIVATRHRVAEHTTLQGGAFLSVERTWPNRDTLTLASCGCLVMLCDVLPAG